MKHSGLRLAVLIVSIYAAFAGFMFAILADESAYPGSIVVRVTGEKVSLGGNSLSSLVNSAAKDADAVVLREVKDLNDPKIRHAYLSNADSSRPEQSWLAEGYPSFSRSIKTVVHPSSELVGVDPRGRYFVFGDDSAPEELAAQFEKIGLRTEINGLGFNFGETIAWFLSGSIGSVSSVVILLITFLVSITTVNQAKLYSIRRLNGMSKNQSIVDDLARLVPFTVWVILACTAIGSTGLFLFNGLNQVSLVLRTWICMVSLGLLLAIAVHVLVVHIVWSVEILAGVKGKLGFGAASTLAYLLRIPSLILAISLVTSSFAAAQIASESLEARHQLTKVGDAATILFESGIDADEEEQFAYSSGQWLKEQDVLGNLLVAIPIESAGPAGQPSEALMVNNSYLSQNAIVASNGKLISPVDPNSVKVLLPDGLQLSQREITDLLEVGGSFDPKYSDNLTIEMIQDGQELTLYEPEPDGGNRPKSVSGVPLVLFGAQSDLIRDDDFMAYASQGRVLFKDFQTAVVATPPQYLGSWIAAYIPVAQKAADEYATRVMELRIHAVAAVLSLLVLLATAVGMAQIHVRGNARLILVKYLHGWDFFSIHKKLFRFELLLVGLVVAWILFGQAISYLGMGSVDQTGRVHGQAAAMDLWQPWAVLTVCLANIVVLVIAVSSRTNVLIRNRSEDTA